MNTSGNRPRPSLRRILMVEFVLLATALVLVLGAASYWAVVRSFREYAFEQQKARASVLAPILAQYYETHGSWEGVEEVLRFFCVVPGPGGRGPGPRRWRDRIVVFDPGGRVVADTFPEYPLDRQEALKQAVPVVYQSEQVGFVALMSASASGLGLGELEQAAVGRVLAAVVATVIASLGVAGFVASRLSRRIALPFEDLRDAAVRVSSGDLGVEVRPVPEGAPQEVADLVAAFNSMSRELRASEERKKAFLRDISHELRTPLTILSGNLEAIGAGVISPDEETLKAMSREVSRLEGLVRSLKDLDEASEAYQLNPAVLAPEEVVEHAVSSISGPCQSRRITVKGYVKEGTGLLYADPDRVRQVLSNLLSNALRYTPDGGWIRVEVGPSGEEGMARITVTDSGPGVPEEEATLVFQRFYRGDPSRARTTGGSGLGLAIAKAIVQRWGGRIWVERDKEGGAAFSFTVPLLKSPPADKEGERGARERLRPQR
ncbi:MAG: HAMP domain-containing histidine kinase [Firmicutes bacterium]|nr:HAMP domain-containing histidine kinase [Candidatus Fermentithermobacillaceae bacterium]